LDDGADDVAGVDVDYHVGVEQVPLTGPANLVRPAW
jgi:hypothetical protein